MTQKGYCKICAFLDHAKWNKDGFQKKVAEGSSLRILKAYLEGLGCQADLKTISSHIGHMESQVIIQRRHEKSLGKKTIDSIQKLRDFFKPQKLLIPSEGCEHKATRKQFNMATEEIDEYCIQCSAHVGSYPIEKAETQSRSTNQLIYDALRGRRL